MFLSSNALSELLLKYPGTVRAALFAHTHMDEFRILSETGSRTSASTVAVKIVPSISPVAGNTPSFLIAKIDPRTGDLLDYTQYLAPADGAAAPWEKQYSFVEQYNVNSFSARNLQALQNLFLSDPNGSSPLAIAYKERYTSRGTKYKIDPVWRSYRCLIGNQDAGGFLECACSTR